MKICKFPIIILAITILSFFSCKKEYDVMIVGKWKHGNISTQFDNTMWIFSDDGQVKIVSDPTINNGRDTTFGTYKIETRFRTPFIHIDGCGGEEGLDGKYEVDELSNKFLKMTRRVDSAGTKDGPSYLRREFKKIK